MSESTKVERKPNIDLVGSIFTIFTDSLCMAQNWGFYMFDPEFNDEPDLRRNIATIWVASLFDSVDSEIRALNTFRKTACERELPHLVETCDQALLFIDCVKEILRKYTRDEQIFLNDLRDQMVHSWLGRRSGKQFDMKYFDGEKIEKVKLTPDEHADIVRPYYLEGDYGQTTDSLLKRFLDLRLRYWHVIKELAENHNLMQQQDVMLSGKPMIIGALTREINGPAIFTTR